MTPPRYDRIGHSKWCTQPQDPDKGTLDKQKVARNYTCRYSLCRRFFIIAQKDFRDSFKIVEQLMFSSIIIPDKKKLTSLTSRVLLSWICLKLDFSLSEIDKPAKHKWRLRTLFGGFPNPSGFARLWNIQTLTKAQLTEELCAASWHHHRHRHRHD